MTLVRLASGVGHGGGAQVSEALIYNKSEIMLTAYSHLVCRLQNLTLLSIFSTNVADV